MRKRRVIIFDDGLTQSALKLFFDARGYETMVVSQPIICPVYGQNGSKPCPSSRLCSDLIVIHNGPRLNGMELLNAQKREGCRLSPRNKAIIAKSLSEEQVSHLRSLGSGIFPEPFDFGDLEDWVLDCQKRMMLSQPLAVRRALPRQTCDVAVQYRFNNHDPGIDARAVNITRCGVCLVSEQKLEPTQVLHLFSEDPRISEEAEVRWVQKTSNGGFFAGLTFCVA